MATGIGPGSQPIFSAEPRNDSGPATEGSRHFSGCNGYSIATAWQTVAVTLFDTPGSGADPGPGATAEAGPAPTKPAQPKPAQIKMVVAYDGTDFSGFAAQSGQPGVRTVGGVLARVDRQGPAPRRAARVRGPHRRGRACVGSGRELRVGAGPRPVAPAGRGHLDARSRGRHPFGRARRPAVRRPPLRHVAHLPLHDPQPPGAGPVPRSLHVVGPRPARPADAATRGRPLRRRARLRVVLSQGSGRLVDHAPRARVALGRRGRRRAPLRDPRQRVLLAARAVDRRHARRSRSRQAPAGRDDGDHPRRRPRRGGAARPAAGLCLWEVGY